MKPKRWLKPSPNGLKVNCEPIRTKEEYESAMQELQNYIDQANKEYHGLGMKIERDGGTQ